MPSVEIAGLTRYLAERKKFWLLPLLIVVVLVALLILSTPSSDLAPFAYTDY